ncbi:hypothetical protein [Streptomyces profundus]|uniref:hypothetical protein n=1 Tax=Streptomyces profundus TaxID=2867410 RepID=UPI001D166DAD|nr:hypothetical protein [Streptomyces sp. MA3_2.13]UED83370.1 hypothetical protein K4G22_03415 [Streptomyces sp. MA3_2.13]
MTVARQSPSRPFPVLWLCGPPGVGKSATGWELYRQLASEGISAGHVDIDQLGMIHPERPDDRDRHRLKARNLAAVAANAAATGASCLIVSGVVDPVHGVPSAELAGPGAPGTALVVCRLRANADELAGRFRGRGVLVHELPRVLAEAETLDLGGFADLVVETTGRSVEDVVRRVRERWSPHGAAAAPPEPPPAPRGAGGAMLWITGARGVGKSTVGWQTYTRIQRAGVPVAFFDLEQIGFLSPTPPDDPEHHRFKARNLAALWRNCAAQGARHLVVNGLVSDARSVTAYREALPTTPLTVCRLEAGPARLADRVARRGAGEGPVLAGDPLNGRSAAELRRAAAEASAQAEALARASIGELVVDTDARSADETAELILSRWPGAPAAPRPSAAG